MSARDFTAEMRGHCIHSIRMTLSERARTPGVTRSARRRRRNSVAIQVSQLRDLGAGPVALPETCGGSALGAPVTWWPARSVEVAAVLPAVQAVVEQVAEMRS